MLFRPAARRPESRLSVPALLFAGLLPVALAGWVLPRGLSPSRPPASQVSPDSSAYWVFLTDAGWDAWERDSIELRVPGRRRTVSRWLQAVSVWASTDQVGEMENLGEVAGVRPVRRLGAPSPSSAARVPAGASISGEVDRIPEPTPAQTDTIYGDLAQALEALGVPRTHDLGFRGAGTRIGILDGLFLSSHSTVRSNPPAVVRDFVEGDLSVDPGPGDLPESASHGTALWSLVAGDLLGTLTGAAPGSTILLARVTSDEDPVGADEDRWVAGLEWLETQGARVVISGVGFRNFEGAEYGSADLNGDVAPATLAADEAARRGVLVLAPMGNGGPEPGTLASPADGDSVLSVGAATSGGVEAAFSGRGPTADGRPKPEVLGPGVGIPAASAVNETMVATVSGTEFSGALVGGAAALFVEAYPERGPMEVLEALARSTEARGGSSDRLPATDAAVLFPDGVWPLPVQGLDDQGRVTTLVPLFRWNVPTTHPLGLPVRFRLELAEDSLFANLVAVDSVVGTFARRIQEPLPPRTRLFWRVEARSAQEVDWTTPPQGPLDVPSWVVLDVLNGPGPAQINDPQPEFRWTPMALPAPAGPFTFDFQVSLDREGEVVVNHPGLEDVRFTPDQPLPFNQPLRWRVIARARSGLADTVTSAAPFVVTGGANPPVTILYQNFPNPFPNPEEAIQGTRIWFDLATETRVHLAVYDIRGRLVRTLIPGRGCGPVQLPPGLYGRDGPSPDPCVTVTWDGRDDEGRRRSPGVYLLRLQAGGVVEVRRMVFWP